MRAAALLDRLDPRTGPALMRFMRSTGATGVMLTARCAGCDRRFTARRPVLSFGTTTGGKQRVAFLLCLDCSVTVLTHAGKLMPRIESHLSSGHITNWQVRA
mgnify:FL=1